MVLLILKGILAVLNELAKSDYEIIRMNYFIN